jgi:hypothetical protein
MRRSAKRTGKFLGWFYFLYAMPQSGSREISVLFLTIPGTFPRPSSR